jgi:serine/threonine protein kinase
MRDGQPDVKVIDFGIAKALTGEYGGATFATGAGGVVGTYESMSPEQLEGSADIDTRSDVYSLGALLYDLLSGSKPFSSESFRRSSDQERQRLIRETEPPRPSTKLAGMGAQAEAAAVAAARQTTPSQLARTLVRELEWIPLKALRNERARRYQTVAQLADDVANYLNGRPLLAAPESSFYRLRKWSRRHQAGLVAAAAVVLLTVVAAGL